MLAARCVECLKLLLRSNIVVSLTVRRSPLTARVPKLCQLLPNVCTDRANESVVCVGLDALSLVVDVERGVMVVIRSQ